MSPDGDYRRPRMHRRQKSVAGARRAAVVCHLENVGVQLVTGVREEPVLLRFFRVADEKEPHRSIADEGDRARQIRIVKRDSPRRIGGEELNTHSVNAEIGSRMNAVPGDPLRFRAFKRGDVCQRSARERSIPIIRRMERMEDARRAANVIGVRVRKDERLELAPAVLDVWSDDIPPRIARTPRGSRVKENPASPIASKQNRVALPNVEHVQLDESGTGGRQRRKPDEGG